MKASAVILSRSLSLLQCLPVLRSQSLRDVLVSQIFFVSDEMLQLFNLLLALSKDDFEFLVLYQPRSSIEDSSGLRLLPQSLRLLGSGFRGSGDVGVLAGDQ
jgi:hypothetical protein